MHFHNPMKRNKILIKRFVSVTNITCDYCIWFVSNHYSYKACDIIYFLMRLSIIFMCKDFNYACV